MNILKINGNNKKYLLKEAFKDILPEGTLKFKKSGFGVPVDYWLKNELKDEMRQMLSKEVIDKQGLFDFDYVNQIFEDHINGKENNKFKLWNLYVFQKWFFKVYEA